MSLPPSPVVAAKRGLGPLWNLLCALGVGVLTVLYILGCVVQIAVLNTSAQQSQQIAADPTSISMSTVTAHGDEMLSVGHWYQLSFWIMYIAFFGWNWLLNTRMRDIGRGGMLRRLLAWKVWRIGVLVSILMILLVQQVGTDASFTQLTKHFHELMAYYAVRGVIGCIYLWVIVSVWRASVAVFSAPDQAVVLAPTMNAVYDGNAWVYAPQPASQTLPQAYETAPQLARRPYVPGQPPALRPDVPDATTNGGLDTFGNG